MRRSCPSGSLIWAVQLRNLAKMALNRIEIWTSAANRRSLRLAERLGFKRDGTLRKRILEDDGQYHDCAGYGVLRDEWSRLNDEVYPTAASGEPAGTDSSSPAQSIES